MNTLDFYIMKVTLAVAIRSLWDRALVVSEL